MCHVIGARCAINFNYVTRLLDAYITNFNDTVFQFPQFIEYNHRISKQNSTKMTIRINKNCSNVVS